MENQLPKNWVKCTIPELITNDGVFVDGDWIESKDQDPTGEVRLIQLADIGVNKFIDKSYRFLNEDTAKKLRCTFIKEGDVLIARMPDPIGRACVFPLNGKNVTAVEVAIIRLNENYINNKWLMHMVNSLKINKEIQSLASGSTRQRISRKNLSTINFPLPPLQEQNRIVAKLDKLFFKLETIKSSNTKIPLLLKDFRKQVLIHAFTGKLTAEWRKGKELESGYELLKKIKDKRLEIYDSLRIEAIKNGKRKPKKPIFEIADNNKRNFIIPDNWLYCTIGDVGDVSNGSTPSRPISEYWNGTIPWISSGLVRNNRITDAIEHLTDLGFENSSVRLLPKGSILLAMIGEGKTRGQSSILDIDATINQNVAGISLEHGLVTSEYLQNWLFLNYDNNRQMGNGTGPQALNCQKVRELPFVLPSYQEQQEIVRKVESLFAKADAIEQQFKTLNKKIVNFPQTLLHKAFKGEFSEQLDTDGDAKELLKAIAELKNIKIAKPKAYKVPKEKLRLVAEPKIK